MNRILLIEDDLKQNLLISEFLQKYNYEVLQIKNFQAVEHEIIAAKPDLILLDITLPYLDGFYLCRFIRKKLTVPIIIVSSRDSDAEKIMGIELGADDYLVKPFNFELLLTKIRASFRRAYGEYASSATNYSIGELSINPNNFKLTYKTREIDLSKNEYMLMKCFMDKRNTIISRVELLMELWDDSSFVDDNTLTVNISRLKSKISELGIVDAIKTIRGSGYIFEWNNPEDSM